MRILTIPDCHITDISPLRGLERLERLEELNARGNPISDITPLRGLTTLKGIDLSHCFITDISPLSRLVNLQILQLNHNHIEDARPLVPLTSLHKLEINHNLIVDHSPLDSLSLDIFYYDQDCAMPPLPLEPRLENRDYPLISSFGIPLRNRPELSLIENLAQHDLIFSGPTQFNLSFRETSQGWRISGRDIDAAVQLRDEHLAVNPNIIFLAYIEMRSLSRDNNPYSQRDTESDDWPGWIRDAHGTIVPTSPGMHDGLIDFTHPYAQDRIVQQAVAASKCGLHDGIIFDYWDEYEPVLRDHSTFPDGYRSNEAEQRARDNFLARIRAAVPPNFLILGNANLRKIPRTAPYVNGGSMESVFPGDATIERLKRDLPVIENTLLWLDTNIRQPRVNILEARTIPTEPFDSPSNLRWVRALTTLVLTHSDSYLTFNDERVDDGVWHHYWYDFWDADLGRPVGEKAQVYEGREGLYIREYTNGWAVYNHRAGRRR